MTFPSNGSALTILAASQTVTPFLPSRHCHRVMPPPALPADCFRKCKPPVLDLSFCFFWPSPPAPFSMRPCHAVSPTASPFPLTSGRNSVEVFPAFRNLRFGSLTLVSYPLALGLPSPAVLPFSRSTRCLEVADPFVCVLAGGFFPRGLSSFSQRRT